MKGQEVGSRLNTSKRHWNVQTASSTPDIDIGQLACGNVATVQMNAVAGMVLARTTDHEVAAGFGAEGILVKSMGEVPAAAAPAGGLARGGMPVLVNVWLDKSDFREGSLSM